MLKILATAFIMALTTCYPVHATLVGTYEAENIFLKGDIISVDQDGSEIDAWINYKKELWHCHANSMSEGMVIYCSSLKPDKD